MKVSSDSATPETKPLPQKSYTDRLIEAPPFSRTPHSDSLFIKAMREALIYHAGNCRVFGMLCKMHGFDPASVRRLEDVLKAPPIFITTFKERRLSSIPDRKIALELTSSGTTGQKSRIILDKLSLLRVRRMAWKIFEALELADRDVRADYICHTYDPSVAKNLGTAWTDKLLTGFTSQGDIFYTLRWNESSASFYYDRRGSVDALKKMESSGRPGRIIGFPAFAMELCEDFKKAAGRYPRIHQESRVITGGGWKDRQDKAVDKGIMRSTLAKKLGIKSSNVRDLFGMVEHGVPYVDCRLGNFHIPVYSHVVARDPATLKALPYGKPGLLQFITPYLSSYPSITLLSSDFGRIDEKCSCGLEGPVMHITGRAGIKKLKGCAIAASTML